MYDVIIIGGGPAGASVSILLCRAGLKVCLFEKRSFPREVLCGEFISHEVTTLLRRWGLYDAFTTLNPNTITSFGLYDSGGRQVQSKLGFSAYGIRRSVFDNMLLEEARREGTAIIQPAMVESFSRDKNGYKVTYSSEIDTTEALNKQVSLSQSSGSRNELNAKIVICGYGKQNIIDKKLSREFISKRSGYNGLKYHIPLNRFNNFPANEISVYTGSNIYCGINKVDAETVTLCYLEKREASSSSKERLSALHKENTFFREILSDLTGIIDEYTLYGTGNIYFGKRKLVEDGAFMLGDAAGVIAPLAGDGIGMAMESASLLADIIIKHIRHEINIEEAVSMYEQKWHTHFKRRLFSAQLIQTFLLNRNLKSLAMLAAKSPTLLSYFINHTRSQLSFKLDAPSHDR